MCRRGVKAMSELRTVHGLLYTYRSYLPVCHIMLLVALNFETLPFQAAEEE